MFQRSLKIKIQISSLVTKKNIPTTTRDEIVEFGGIH